MLRSIKHHPHSTLIAVIIGTLIALFGCMPLDQAHLQTAVAQAGQTTIAEGKKFAETEAAHLKETAVAQVATQLANVATELAKKAPEPWDVSWLPSDSPLVIDRINTILSSTGLEGQGAIILESAQEFGVNPAFALAMFRKEATFAAPNTRASSNNNPGNIIATGDCRGKPAYSTCQGIYGEVSTDGRFGIYSSMEDGIKAYFMLLNKEYKPGTRRNCSDIACIITVYCPPSDCDTSIYINQITQWTQDYQHQLLTP